ncbi:MAG: DNA primase [Candidatus Cloacimonetes bacterium]|nr:DNA primase [Candidatus Cloacimonadota bacterium]
MDRSLIDQIRQANDIVEVVQSYVPLKHVGANWRGICPFHNDTRPSMHVSQSKQIFKCFACGKGGNVFTFVQDYEKLSFIETVKKLAARVGIAIPDRDKTQVVSTKRQKLLAVYKSAGEFFADNLFRYGQSTLDYLEKRHISAETAKELQLGYALASRRSLANHLMKENYSVDLLKESGLFRDSGGSMNDLFWDRLMFPIHNSNGDVIAFGGRLMGEGDSFKYINSPSTELYTKGNELYGLHKTKYNISKKGYSLVAEGYFDFLRLYESGFDNVVCPLGTALTLEQIYLLNRFAQQVVMLYDADNAGVKAAVRGGLICLSKGMQVNVGILPKGEDPDSYLLNYSKEELQKIIDDAPSLIPYMATSKEVEESTEERIQLILDALRELSDPIRKELLIKDISEAFGVSQNALFASMRRGGAQRQTQEETVLQSSPKGMETEKMVIILGLKDRESYNLLANELSVDYFNNKTMQKLFSLLTEALPNQEHFEPAALLDEIDNDEIKNSLAELLFEDLQDVKLVSMIRDLKLHKMERDIAELDNEINANPSDLDLLKKKEKLTLEYRKMTKKVVRKLFF